MTAGIGNKSELIDYTSIKNKVDSILGIGAGTTGYGQTTTSSSISANSIISADNWRSLRNDMIKARQHQTGTSVGNSATIDNNNLILIQSGATITESIRNQYDTFANTLVIDKNKVHSSQLTVYTLALGQRNAPWQGSLTHSITVSPSAAGNGAAENLRYFFNAGGTITFQPIRVGPTDIPKNSLWTTLLSSVGTVTFSHNSTRMSGSSGDSYPIGFFQLTESNQLIFGCSKLGLSSGTMSFSISARTNSTKTVIYFTVVFLDHESSIITGQFVSLVQQSTPSGSNVSVHALSASDSGMDANIISPSYSITPSTTIIGEGGTVQFNVSCSIPGAKTLYWVTTGNVSANDFSDNILKGSVALSSDGTGYINRTIVNDHITEGQESFTLILTNSSNPAYGTTLATSSSVTITESAPLSPTYSISLSPAGTITKGSTMMTYTIQTTNVTNGSVIYGMLNGGFTTATIPITINNNSATGTFPAPAEDGTGVDVSFHAELKSAASGGATLATSNTVVASSGPSSCSIVLSPTGPVEKGSTVMTYTIQTRNVANGTTMYGMVSGSGISSLPISVTIINNAASGTFMAPSEDGVGANVSFYAVLKSAAVGGSVLATSNTVVARGHASKVFRSDGSFTVPAGIYSISAVAVGGGGSGGDGAGVDGSPQGGFAGSVSSKNIAVSPGNTITVRVGNGGSGVRYNSGSKGNSGSSSTVNVNGFPALIASGGAGGGRVGGNMVGQSSGSPFNGSGGGSKWGSSGSPGGVGAGGGGVDGKAYNHYSGDGGDGEVRISW